MPLSNALQVENLPLDLVKDPLRRIRKASKKQTPKTISFIEACGGIVTPVILDKTYHVVVGEHFVTAARVMGLKTIPVIRADHLSEAQIKLLRTGYYRVAQEAEWDKEALAEEFRELEVLIPEIDLTMTGFEMAEIDLILDPSPSDPNDDLPPSKPGPSVVQLGDIWSLGGHKLICGDSLKPETYEKLMAGEKALLIFIDPPYNVPISGHVCGNGAIQHPEFVMASGEMTTEEFDAFLTRMLSHLKTHSEEGSIHYVCIDWRHLRELISAGAKAGLTLINLCVWVKDNPGMGSLYRSQHELVLVFKNGEAKHVNNIQLGKHGRNRSNVWSYPSVNSFAGGRMNELALHPTVKPAQMVMDTLKDCSKRGSIVLDAFGGSGTTLIAAEKTGRKARLIELDPLYCDVTIRRWQALTGNDAVNTVTGKTFNETQTEEVKHEQK